jgi:hypothetical protein
LSVQLAQSADDALGGVVLQQVFQEGSLCKRFLDMSTFFRHEFMSTF